MPIPSADALWNAIRLGLDRRIPDWEAGIEQLGTIADVERREAGHHWGDNKVFECVLFAVLSNNTDWEKIENVMPELGDLFSGFSLSAYAETTPEGAGEYVCWFKDHNAASTTLRKNLLRLAETARILRDWSAELG